MNIEREQYKELLDLLYKQKKNGEVVTLPMLTGSMYPSILPGDMLEIKVTTWKHCHIGDIIVFKEDQKLITHRLLFKAEMDMLTIAFQKGDNNRYGSFILKDDIVGKVIAIKRKKVMVINLLHEQMRKKARCTAYKHIMKTIFHLLIQFGKGIRK